MDLDVATANGGSGAASSLHEEVLVQLRRYITEELNSSGDRISERLLCERFGVSRTPLREALKVLASEGLIELLPNRGARIKNLSAVEIREVFEVLGALEATAGELACRDITEDQVASIERWHFDMYSAYMRRDLPAYFEFNQKIHAAIIDAANNSVLKTTHAGLATRIHRLRFHANKNTQRDRWSEAVREHEMMLEALHQRDGDRLGKVLREHMLNKSISVIEQVS